MKHIIKQKEPRKFSEWKALANDNWQPAYNDLSGETKAAVKESLMKEQGYICCYCERRLSDEDSHIEHFIPQSSPKADPLDYSNMLCSCQNKIKKGEPRHCGNLKGNWFDENLLVSPLDPGCEQNFVYTGDGGIHPNSCTNIAAKETINHLGLNIPKLRSLRAKIIEPFLDVSLSDDQFRSFVNGYLAKDAKGWYGEFWSTIKFLF